MAKQKSESYREFTYYIVENNGINVSPEFMVRGVFKTLEEAQDKLNKLNEEAEKNGWTRHYVLTR